MDSICGRDDFNLEYNECEKAAFFRLDWAKFLIQHFDACEDMEVLCSLFKLLTVVAQSPAFNEPVALLRPILYQNVYM